MGTAYVANERCRICPQSSRVRASWQLDSCVIRACQRIPLPKKTLVEHEQTSGDYENFEHYHAFVTSFMISYGKCFASSGSGIVALDPNKVFGQDNELRSTHDKIIIARNKAVAHNDHSDWLRTTMAVKEESKRILIKHIITLASPKDELSRYGDALRKADEYAVARANKILSKLSMRFGKPIEIGQF